MRPTAQLTPPLAPHPARPDQPPRPRSTPRGGLGPSGQALLRAVREHPGIHFRGLARAAGITSAGQLRHHLDRLERQGLVVELSDGRYKRFFATMDHVPELRPGMARFSRVIPRRIGEILLERPMNRTELRRRLGCADSTLGYHLNRMLQHGDVQRQRVRDGCQYALRDQALVRRVLQSQDDIPDTTGETPAGRPAGTPQATPSTGEPQADGQANPNAPRPAPVDRLADPNAPLAGPL